MHAMMPVLHIWACCSVKDIYTLGRQKLRQQRDATDIYVHHSEEQEL